MDSKLPNAKLCTNRVLLLAFLVQTLFFLGANGLSSYNCKPSGTNITCVCVYDSVMNGTEVNCKSVGLTSFPDAGFDDVDDGYPIVHLELSNNSIKSIDELALEKYPALQMLILDTCELESIDDLAFFDHVTLETLVLANNPALKKVPMIDVTLQKLDLSNCGLNETGDSKLDLENIADAPYLYTVILDNNGLSLWPKNFNTKIGSLSLKYNNLETIADLSDELDRLEELYLDHNSISNLDSSVPSLPESLHILSLDYNPISVIDNDYFHNLNFIEDLSISHTNLQSISAIAFQGMSPMYSGHRIRLTFQYNYQLEQVSRETFDPFLYSPNEYDLLEIELDNSFLDCVCEMIWIPQLLTNQQSMGLSPDEVTISGTCSSPIELSGVSLDKLKESDITCNSPEPDDGGGDSDDSSARNAAIVLGIILAMMVVGTIGYFLYDRYFKNTYLSV